MLYAQGTLVGRGGAFFLSYLRGPVPPSDDNIIFIPCFRVHGGRGKHLENHTLLFKGFPSEVTHFDSFVGQSNHMVHVTSRKRGEPETLVSFSTFYYSRSQSSRSLLEIFSNIVDLNNTKCPTYHGWKRK